MIIGHQIIFNNIDFNLKGVVEKAPAPNLSYTQIYDDRAEVQPYFRKHKKELKEFPVDYRIITNTKDQRQNEIIADQFIGSIFTKTPALFQLDNKYCKAILIGAETEYFSNSVLIKLVFINLDGLWHGPEIVTTNLAINNQGIQPTERAIIEIVPTATAISVKDSKGHNILATAFNTTNPITIDLEAKTIKQNGLNLPQDVKLSRFFILEKGITNLVITGGTATIKYREVVAL